MMNTERKMVPKEEMLKRIALSTGTDINLLDIVRNLLASKGVKATDIEYFNSYEYVKLAESQLPAVQRYYLNNHFTLLLIDLESKIGNSEACSNARLHLLPDGEIEDWIRAFETIVLPFLLEHDVFNRT